MYGGVFITELRFVSNKKKMVLPAEDVELF